MASANIFGLAQPDLKAPDVIPSTDFGPAATLEALAWRSRQLQAVRQFFFDRGYWEAETPLLSEDGPVDPHLATFTFTSSGRAFHLQTSPEFGLKRLVATGAEAVFQLSKAFRQGERGRLHNPEFTMLEWYQVGTDYQDQMTLVEQLIRALSKDSSLSLEAAPFERLTYRTAFQHWADIDPANAGVEGLRSALAQKGITPPQLEDEDRDGWLNVLLAESVEPRLGASQPVFLCDYPATQSALAAIRPEPWPVAERFELYSRGIELCNGYTELTDHRELQSRMATESARRQRQGDPPLAESNRLMSAMAHGLPPCAGVALGVDRLLMILGGYDTIDDVIAFPWDRA